MAKEIDCGRGEVIIECGRYEVHPGARGGWTVVGPSGTPQGNWSDKGEAIRIAEELDHAE